MIRLIRRAALGLSVFSAAVQVAAQGNPKMPRAEETSPPFTWPTPSFVWDPVFNTCKGLGAAIGISGDENAQQALLDEVILMSSNALNKMHYLESGTGDEFLNAQTKASFNLFFNLQADDAQDRWNHVKSALESMVDLKSQEYLYIMCDDLPLFSTKADGTWWTFPHDQSMRQRYASSDVTCATKARTNAYRLRWDAVTAQTPQYLVICTKQNSYDYSIDAIASKVTSNKSLYDFVTLTTTLFHEFLHVRVASMRGDAMGGTGEGGERYGMSGAWETRMTYGPENPDSVMLFALSLALDQWFWGNGYAQSREDYLNWQKLWAQGQS